MIYQLSNGGLIPNLPPQIKLEQNQRKGNVITEFIIRGRWKTWSKSILTGLIKTKDNIYTGDQYKKGNKSFLIFKFSNDRTTIQIMFFKNYMPFPKYRAQMVSDYKQYFDK
jgi:hypothetical protein